MYQQIRPNKMDTIQQIWEKYCNDQDWNFVTIGLKNGDFYFILGFMPVFRRLYVNNKKIRILADTEGKFLLSKIFGSDIYQCVFVPELKLISNEEIADWCRYTRRDQFEVGSLIRLHPYLFSDRQYKIALILRNSGSFNLIELFRTALRIPPRMSPVAPTPTNTMIAKAEERFQLYGLERGKTLVIFPYAQSLNFDASSALRQLAIIAKESGFVVCSSVHGTEKPVHGTLPIELDFDYIIPFCVLAGFVVALRSGICDILSSARLNKLYLYFNDELPYYESPNALGMCDCNENFVLTSNDNAQIAAELMYIKLNQARYSNVEQFIPPAVLDYFSLIDSIVGSVVYNRSHSCAMGRYALLAEAVLAEGWGGLEQSGVWSIGFRSVAYIIVPKNWGSLESSEFYLGIECVLAISDTHPKLNIVLDINGETVQIQDSTKRGQFQISIKLSPAQIHTKYHRMIFYIENPRSPCEQTNGENPDDRLLGIKLKKTFYYAI